MKHASGIIPVVPPDPRPRRGPGLPAGVPRGTPGPRAPPAGPDPPDPRHLPGRKAGRRGPKVFINGLFLCCQGRKVIDDEGEEGLPTSGPFGPFGARRGGGAGRASHDRSGLRFWVPNPRARVTRTVVHPGSRKGRLFPKVGMRCVFGPRGQGRWTTTGGGRGSPESCRGRNYRVYGVREYRTLKPYPRPFSCLPPTSGLPDSLPGYRLHPRVVYVDGANSHRHGSHSVRKVESSPPGVSFDVLVPVPLVPPPGRQGESLDLSDSLVAQWLPLYLRASSGPHSYTLGVPGVRKERGVGEVSNREP